MRLTSVDSNIHHGSGKAALNLLEPKPAAPAPTARKSAKPKAQTAAAPRVYAYCRVSTGKQDHDSQRIGILDYAKRSGLKVSEWVDEEVSGRTPVAERRLGKELIPELKPGDVLLTSELSRLGRTLLDVLQTLATIADRGAQVRVIKGGHTVDGSMGSKVIVTVMALAAEIERDLISARTREGIERARASGKKIGRQPGQVIASKLDQHDAEIRRVVGAGGSMRVLARLLNCNAATVIRYCARHGIERTYGKPKAKKGASK
jgi:DNA invertase Pin-like site-specific DNA recombinase